MSSFAVVLAAAGRSSRFGDAVNKKVFTLLAGKPVWMYAAEAFCDRRDVSQVILVIAEDDRHMFKEKFAGNAAFLGIKTVIGGEHRAESVRRGLDAIDGDADWVAIHDAARPCIATPWIDAVFSMAQKHGAAILATPCQSTIKRVSEDLTIQATVPRQQLWLAQTPQVFKKANLLEAYAKHADPSAATDEASLVEAAGFPVRVVDGSPLNVKITTKADMRFAELALKALPKPKAFPFD